MTKKLLKHKIYELHLLQAVLAELDKLSKAAPLERLGTSEDIAETVMHLENYGC